MRYILLILLAGCNFKLSVNKDYTGRAKKCEKSCEKHNRMYGFTYFNKKFHCQCYKASSRAAVGYLNEQKKCN